MSVLLARPRRGLYLQGLNLQDSYFWRRSFDAAVIALNESGISDVVLQVNKILSPIFNIREDESIQ